MEDIGVLHADPHIRYTGIFKAVTCMASALAAPCSAKKTAKLETPSTQNQKITVYCGWEYSHCTRRVKDCLSLVELQQKGQLLPFLLIKKRARARALVADLVVSR